jgi:mannose-1-phosphate guanylyltransferase
VNEHLHAVILAGGSGTRFWPLSRSKRPKQFLSLATERPLIVETFERVRPLCGAARAWVVCGRDHERDVRALLPELPLAQVLVEPAAKNTAPAIGLAAAHAAAVDPEAVLLVLPSDHHIAKPESFRAALEAAGKAALSGALVTIGIKPTRPETGYGYLQRGEARGDGTFAVQKFVEKPDAQTAARYVADAAYSWNAGIFAFKAQAYLDALERHLPVARTALRDLHEAGFAPEAAQRAFARMPSISIDYGVMEPESQRGGPIAMVPGDFGWSDVGSFAALPEVRKLDERGNAKAGDALLVDCDDCVVLAEGQRLVAAVGVTGLCVIDAGDALLVVPRERAQDVRAVVDALKSAGRADKL